MERDRITVLRRGRPLFRCQNSRNIREPPLWEGPADVMSVARPSDRSQSLVSTREFIIEVLPRRVMGVGNCSHRTHLLLTIRLVTKRARTV